jgi:hypothetical protein
MGLYERDYALAPEALERTRAPRPRRKLRATVPHPRPTSSLPRRGTSGHGVGGVLILGLLLVAVAVLLF